jgi:alkaline phosphatase D
VEYQEKGKPAEPKYRTATVKTQKAHAFSAHLLADQVLPGRDYAATLYINGKAVKLPYPFEFHARDLWQYRTDPPAFQAIIGSCAYFNDSLYDRPGKPYGSDYEIFKAISKENADLMLWLGDNVYLNEPDWNTMTGIHYRYTKGRSFAALQPALAKMSHYAVWDDHDYGPNDADRSFIHKDKTLAAFQDFWANPSYGLPGEGGITSMFSWSDCDFFLIDDRWFRTPNMMKSEACEMLGQAQVTWLVEALKSSKATFKFVCVGGLVLSTAAVYENYIRLCPEERKQLLDAIALEEIPGVIFLTGDRHHSEVSYYKPANGYGMYDITVSPFTSGTYPGDNGANTLLVAGSEYVGHNYGILDVSGPRKERILRLSYKDKTGTEVYSMEIKATDMWAK